MPFNNSADSLKGWTAVPSAKITLASGTLPASVTVYELDGPSVMFKACHKFNENGADKYQVVNFEGKMDASGDIKDAIVQYCYYTEGTPRFNSWNALHNYDDRAPLKNQFYNAAWNPVQAANYTNPNGTDPAYKPVAAPGSPDLTSYLRSTVNPAEVSFEYVNIITSFSGTPADEGKWFYNKDDGYFYYIGVIPGGTATAEMLQGVNLSGNADQMLWQKYEYTLVVCVEGLQANEKALVASDTATGAAAGWKLPSGDLLDTLTALCEAYNA